jgi:hypothetical protein
MKIKDYYMEKKDYYDSNYRNLPQWSKFSTSGTKSLQNDIEDNLFAESVLNQDKEMTRSDEYRVALNVIFGKNERDSDESTAVQSEKTIDDSATYGN